MANHLTPEERAALQELEATGLADVIRLRWPDAPNVFTYWDYRAGMFHQDLGMRIDLVLAGRTERLAVTDAPACGYDHVYVTVTGVRFHQQADAADNDPGWQTLALGYTPQRIDLPNH